MKASSNKVLQSKQVDKRAPRDKNALNLLRSLVRIRTEHTEKLPGAPFGRGCAEALQFVVDTCKARGMKTGRFEHSMAWAEVGNRGPLALFPVHLDVVPAGDGWQVDPYAAEVIDGVLYGRGCMDNKASASMMIVLLEELVGRADLPCRLRVLFGTDEESGMSDLVSYLENGGEQPVFGFVPDASFPVVRGEKARVHLRVFHSWRQGEWSGTVLSGGVAANVVPAEACVRFADGTERRAHGRAAHGAFPERGINAVAQLVCNIVDEGLPGSAELELVERLVCRDVLGSNLGVACDDATFGPLTVNLGIIDMSEHGLTLDLDIRFGTDWNARELVNRVSTTFGSDWTIEVVQDKPVHLVSEDDPCVQVLLRAYEQVVGKPGSCSVMSGGTYASHLPALVAFGPKMPNTHCGAHGVDEHVSLQDLSLATEVYRQAIEGILALADTWEG